MTAEPISKARPGLVLSVTSLGALLASLNFSTLIIALPALMRGLHSTLLQGVWVLMAYMVAQTVMVLMGGSLADTFGRRRLYVTGMALFTVVSLAAGYSTTADTLIFFRVIQGIGGALVMANSTALVADAYPRNALGRALGVNVMVVAVGQIIGPVLGGWLTTDYGWSWTFWFNVPFGVIGVLWTLWVFSKDGREKVHGRQMDWGGIAAYLIAVTGLLMALSEGSVIGWHEPFVYVTGALFVVAMPIWILIERKHPAPLLHLPLFKNRIFGLGALAASLNGVARMAITFLMIFYFQGAKGDSALTAGLLLIPMAVGMLVVSPLSGGIADRYGPTLPATGGILLSMVGLIGLAVNLSLHSPYWLIALWLLLAGLGSGFFNSPNTSSMMNAAGASKRGEASGIRALTTNTGMMLSVAFSFLLVTRSIPRAAMLAIFAGTAVNLPNAQQVLGGFMNGLHLAFWVMAAVSLVAAILSALRENPNTESEEHPMVLPSHHGKDAQHKAGASG